MAANSTLKCMIQWAWVMQEYQILGGPAWINTAGFDVVAKPEEATTPSPDQEPHFRQMIQRLLADRFQLEVRHESRELQVYSLVVAKGGLKIPASEKSQGTQFLAGTRIHVGKGELTAEKVSMPLLTERVLSGMLGRPVTDKTGLPDYYDFKLTWNPDEASPDSTGPSIFTAIQEQLGLRLESQKAPAEVLIIEHAAKPSAN